MTNPEFRSVTASAARIEIGSRSAVKNVLAKRQDWQTEAMEDARAIGELAYGITVPSSLISRTTFFVAKQPGESDSEPIRLDGLGDDAKTEKGVIEQFDRLGNTLHRTDIQFDLSYNLQSVGEAYLICFGERPADAKRGIPATPEHWEIRSIFEVKRESRTVAVWDQLRDERVSLDHAKGDAFIRIWRSDPFQHDVAWSNFRAILNCAEELMWWDGAAQAAAKSRHALAGMVAVPSDLTVKAEEGDPPNVSGSDLFVHRFVDNAVRGIRNPRDASASVPFAFTYPRNEQGKSGVELIEWQRPQDELLEKRTERSLQRIEQGINLPVGVISGIGQSTHWGGGQVEEGLFRDHIEPIVILMCSALTKAFLLPILLEMGIPEAEKYFVWYDASNLIIHRDRAANALRAIELGGINWRAGRRELGFSESDAPTPEEAEEILEWIQGVRGRNNEANVESEEGKTPEDPNASPKENEPGKRTSSGERNPTARGRGQDPVQAASIRAVQVLCDEKVRRAIERAGNRLRNRAKRDPALYQVIERVPAIEVASYLGPEHVSKLQPSDIFDGAFDDLHGRVIGLLSLDTLALDTIGPCNGLIHELRRIASEYLYKPPTNGIIVPMELVEQFMELCIEPETLSIDPIPA